MSTERNLVRLGALIFQKRQNDGIGLRTASQQSGLSPSTLSRLERGVGAPPDAEMMRKLSEWLNISVGELLFSEEEEKQEGFEKPEELSTPELIAVHLRADKKLSKETANALAELVRLAYAQFASKEENE